MASAGAGNAMAVRRRVSRDSGASGSGPGGTRRALAPELDGAECFTRHASPRHGWARCSSSKGASPRSSSTRHWRSKPSRAARLGESPRSAPACSAKAALAKGLAQQLDLPLIDLRLRTPQPEALASFPNRWCVTAPRAAHGDRPTTGSTSRSTARLPTPCSRELRVAAELPILLVISPTTDIDMVIDRSYSVLHGLEQFTDAFDDDSYDASGFAPAPSRSTIDDNTPVAQVVHASHAGRPPACVRRPPRAAGARFGSDSVSTVLCTTPRRSRHRWPRRS